MIISKKDFNKYINILREEDDYIDKLNEMSEKHEKKIGLGIEPIQFSYNTLNSIVIEILKKIFEDDNDWIGYFCYEIDYGRAYTYGCITEEDGTPIPLYNADDLYDFLVKEMNEKHSQEI